jgi:cytochrome c
VKFPFPWGFPPASIQEISVSMSAIRSFRLFILAAPLALPAACAGSVGDAANGKELFMNNACPTCHSVTKGDSLTVGPNLAGVVGRRAGTTVSLMGPSENLKKYGVIWNAATLDEFLSNPDAKVPGTAMIGMLSDPQQRADVIAYLSTLKD